MNPLRRITDALSNAASSASSIGEWAGRKITKLLESEYDRLSQELVSFANIQQEELESLEKKVSTSKSPAVEKLRAKISELRLLASTPIADKLWDVEVKPLLSDIHDPVTKYKILDLVTVLFDRPDKDTIIQTLCQIAPDDRLDVLQNTIELGLNSPSNIPELMNLIAATPHDERGLLVTQTASLLRENLQNEKPEDILNMLIRYGSHERDQLMLLTMSVLGETQVRVGQFQTVFEALFEVPFEMRQEIIKDISPFANTVESIQSLISSISTLHKRGQITVVEKLKPLASEVNLRELHALMFMGSTSSPEQFDSLLHDAARLIETLKPSNERLGILLLLRQTHPHFRLELLDHIFTLLEGVSDSDARDLLFTMCAMTEKLSVQRTFDAIENTVNASLEPQQRLEYLQGLHNKIVEEIQIQEKNVYSITTISHSLKDAKSALSLLAEAFSNKRASRLKLTLLDSKAQDAGGVTRQYLAQLFEALIKALPFERCANGLYKLRLSEPLTAEDAEALQNMGKLMLFCLNARSDTPYPIGMHFDLGVFAALTSICRSRFDVELTQDNFAQAFALYREANTYNEPDKKKIDFIEKALNPLTDGMSDSLLIDAYAIVEQDEDIIALECDYDVGKIRQNFPAIQNALKRHVLHELIIPELTPLFEIAKGIRSAQFIKIMARDIATMTPKELSECLQGTVDRQTIINKLLLNPEIPAEKADWLHNWLLQASDKSVADFLFAMTGAPAIGSLGLTINPLKDVDCIFAFHTCFNILDIAFDKLPTEQAFIDRLNLDIQDQSFNIA